MIKGLFVILCFGIVFVNGDEDVKVLTAENFDNFTKENDVLVKFYAPWCGHCKKLAPEFESAAKKLKELDSKVVLADVDATVESSLASRYSISGYPTLKYFTKGESMEYTGGRTSETIVSWIQGVSGPALTVVEESDPAIKDIKEVTFVARVTSVDCTEYKLFESLAKVHRFSGKFLAVLKSEKNEITCHRPHDEPVVHTLVNETNTRMSDWIKAEHLPHFGHIDGDNYAAYEAQNKELVWVAGTKDHYNEIFTHVHPVAKGHRDTHRFVWLDTDKYGSHAENALGISKFPGIVIRMNEGGRFVFPDPINKDNLHKFMTNVKAGTVEKFYKSEDIPDTNDEHVKVVVGKQFEEMMFHDDKDVMLMIYAPWCGHCKRLEPFYKELAEILHKETHVMFAKMDGTLNEPPNSDFSFKGFPTIYYVKAGTKKPEAYDGGRTLESLYLYVKGKVSKPITTELPKEEEKEEEEEEKKEEEKKKEEKAPEHEEL